LTTIDALPGVSPSGEAGWFGAHKQRVLYVLAACALVAAVGAATIGGFRLHHAADVERQALRTQDLAGAVARLQNFAQQLEDEGASAKLDANRRRALATANRLFQNVAAHDRAESDRLRIAYQDFVAASTGEFEQAMTTGRISPPQQGAADRTLARFDELLNVEVNRLAATAQRTNPDARLALITAAALAGLVVALLILQFELQRRAGRIDRDNAARAQELSRLREALVATVSHELRTPLTSIVGYLDLIADEPEIAHLTAEQQGFLAVVQRNADRLQGLVGDLLLVAEADGGRLALDIQEVDLDELAATCVESARPAADARRIELTLHRGFARRIQGDPTRLEQMMDNLVSNAIKFTPEGGRVAVRTGVNDDHALFEVSDTGPGIAVPDQAHLFDRFFRTRSAIDGAVKGTGLGLAITKAIVDAHRGTITVESSLGKHSTFRVSLPAT
jgi:signal transduction histidine kinase